MDSPDSREAAAAEADFRQAAYFRAELIRVAGELDTQIAALKTTLDRQAGRRELGFHATRTRIELRAALAEREQIAQMLIGLDQSRFGGSRTRPDAKVRPS